MQATTLNYLSLFPPFGIAIGVGTALRHISGGVYDLAMGIFRKRNQESQKKLMEEWNEHTNLYREVYRYMEFRKSIEGKADSELSDSDRERIQQGKEKIEEYQKRYPGVRREDILTHGAAINVANRKKCSNVQAAPAEDDSSDNKWYRIAGVIIGIVRAIIIIGPAVLCYLDRVAKPSLEPGLEKDYPNYILKLWNCRNVRLPSRE